MSKFHSFALPETGSGEFGHGFTAASSSVAQPLTVNSIIFRLWDVMMKSDSQPASPGYPRVQVQSPMFVLVVEPVEGDLINAPTMDGNYALPDQPLSNPPKDYAFPRDNDALPVAVGGEVQPDLAQTQLLELVVVHVLMDHVVLDILPRRPWCRIVEPRVRIALARSLSECGFDPSARRLANTMLTWLKSSYPTSWSWLCHVSHSWRDPVLFEDVPLKLIAVGLDG